MTSEQSELERFALSFNIDNDGWTVEVPPHVVAALTPPEEGNPDTRQVAVVTAAGFMADESGALQVCEFLEDVVKAVRAEIARQTQRTVQIPIPDPFKVRTPSRPRFNPQPRRKEQEQ